MIVRPERMRRLVEAASQNYVRKFAALEDLKTREPVLKTRHLTLAGRQSKRCVQRPCNA